jgi:hypothetical protein
MCELIAQKIRHERDFCLVRRNRCAGRSHMLYGMKIWDSRNVILSEDLECKKCH